MTPQFYAMNFPLLLLLTFSSYSGLMMGLLYKALQELSQLFLATDLVIGTFENLILHMKNRHGKEGQ